MTLSVMMAIVATYALHGPHAVAIVSHTTFEIYYKVTPRHALGYYCMQLYRLNMLVGALAHAHPTSSPSPVALLPV